MGIMDFFKSTNLGQRMTRWREFGTYTATFSAFGTDMYRSELVRSCIRPIAEHTSKANVVCKDERIRRILEDSPNMYMNGKSFLAKTRTHLELKNTAFIYIMRDDRGRACGFYPVPYATYEALEYMNGLFIRFKFLGDAANELVLPWEDLAVLRKDYNQSDIGGDSNDAILGMLELINTTNEGVANAVRATANLRGILKSTKAMLSPEDIKKNKDQFVKDYMSLENSGGIASLDATQEFTPISMNPTVTNAEQMKEFRESVYRYFGVSEEIIQSNYTEQQMEAFYESRIEPFLVDLSTELTKKVFTERERAHGRRIIFEANKLQFASMVTKISVFKEVVLYGGMTTNEWREGCNMAPIEGGDTRIMRLDAGKVEEEGAEEENEEGN